MASSNTGQAQQNQDPEHIIKLKQLIHFLETTLMTLMHQADAALQQNMDSVSSGKTADENPHKLESSFEDFMNMCDQLEDLLETMKATERQTVLSMKYTPRSVTNTKMDANQDTQSYSEYLSLVKNQITLSNDLQELLSDFVKSKLT
ncbi:uncharacterized protein LOC116300852 [Actinia tenebrosa]|uniref:Mediator of RNA polymerase II transcription subunit 29 n=1 Tax=Actinia tenebrosa TaxID=6105 RepID=A0A6P8IG38_ACTTE|nr:uncharacterized protein LOC116300852 [Actinia tenebrosa]